MIRCEVLGPGQDDPHGELVDIELQDGIESVEGIRRFRVRRDQLAEPDLA
jgi:hypothetical protein